MFYKILLISLGINLIYAQTSPAGVIEKEITFISNGLKIAGTLALPDDSGKHPCIILISGGYPDTRDAQVMDFKSFKVLSDHFVKNGYAVLRYDDRGMGQSEGKHTWKYTAFELADDVLNAFDFLDSHPNIDEKRIGLCGHSFGAIISPYVYSKQRNIDFIICIAGMGTTFYEQWMEYRKLSLTNSEYSSDEIEDILKYDNQLITQAKESDNWEALRSELIQKVKLDYSQLTADELKQYSDYESYKQNSYYGVLSEMLVTPFAQSLWEYSPLPYLEKTNCSLLILFGEKDESMPPDIHLPPIRDVLNKSGHENYQFHIIRNVNHHMTENYEPGMTFSDEFLTLLSDWFKNR